MKTPEQQSELSKLRDEYQDSISTLIDEGWIRLGGSIEAYVEALEAKATSAAELVEKAREWCSKTITSNPKFDVSTQGEEYSANDLFAFLEAEVGK